MAKKTAKPVVTRQSGRRGSLHVLVLAFATIAIVLMVFAAPALIVFLIGMAPTAVAIFIDRDPRKYASVSVAAMNFAGVSFYLADFLMGTASLSRALELVSNVFVLAVIYSAAAAGWVMILAMPPVTAVVMKALADNRIQTLRKEQRELVDNWGEEVAGRQ